MTETMTETEFEIALRRTGLVLDPAQRAVLLDVLPQFDAMLARNRTPRDRSAEPAHMFAAQVFVPGAP